MAALGHPAPHAIDMQLDVGESHKPHVYGQTNPGRLLEQSGHGLAAQRGFKSKIGVLVDCSL